MRTLIIIFLMALALTAMGTPMMRRFAIWIGFVDAPAGRKLHQEPMPLMGGVAIFGGAILAFIIFFIQFNITRQVIGIFGAITLVAAVGLIDDRLGLAARYKLLGQLLGVLILIYTGVYVQLPFPAWLNYLVTAVWIIGISNAINFLDNMDGLSAGVSAVAAAFIVLIGAINGQYLVASMAAAVFGACLGFLRHNFKPATIFMGDAGALFLGFILAILALQLRFPQNDNVVTWMVPVLILGMPIFDTTLVIISRSRRGVNPLTTAGKDHTSHRLVELGFGQREAVLVLYLFSGMFGMVAMFITQASPVDAYSIGAVVAAGGLYLIWHLERWRDQQKAKAAEKQTLSN
ncbi:MAG: undecaprenyl/decaprenyl-phosphate alpha-N-acetylglucosaminyl 1-phosphate transferase [Anaerolineales bacterium]|nr:undecaprenyl/decaprenyl-phosphate alpha-N-acetylglucosaminyl 1-phosphate transferase [Anaerolineales bacterium]